ncbi:MAG: NAD(P)/FAD-dependent oxidoreductase [Burkholderiaceae bacterium]
MSAAASPVASKPLADHYDLVIVGAGFGGMYMLHKARALGLSARVFEAADDVGGTWYWNRYPGARCDIESLEYSYSFDEDLQQSWRWSERFATQPEILRYAQHVAERFGLRTDISFNARVGAAHFDESASRWRVSVASSADGAPLAELSALVVQACAVLASASPASTASPKTPITPAEWPHEGVDFTGKRVGVIGTEVVGDQSIGDRGAGEGTDRVPAHAELRQYPAHNAPIDPACEQRLSPAYELPSAQSRDDRRVRRQCPHARGLGALGFRRAPARRYSSTLVNARPRFHACLRRPDARRQRQRIRVQSSFAARSTRSSKTLATAELLSPTQVIGCKRLCVDTDYYA